MYSNSLEFFLDHQIAFVLNISKTEGKYFSRINGELFIPSKTYVSEPLEEEILSECKKIHESLINQNRCYEQNKKGFTG